MFMGECKEQNDKQIAAKQDGKQVTLLPQQFCADAQYFMTTVYKSIPSSKFNDVIEIRPYWVTLDGTRVYGVHAASVPSRA